MDQASPLPTTRFSLNWKIAGKAGEGIMTTAETFARACHHHGLKIFNYYEYPSLIKGGHQTGQVFASYDQATSHKRELDVLIALDENGFKQHEAEITSKTVVIAEPGVDQYDIHTYDHLGARIFQADITNIARETTGSSIAANTVSLGISAYLLGMDPQVFLDLIREQFASKGEDVINKNNAAFDAGYKKATEFGQPIMKVEKRESNDIVLTGGEAIGMGAIAAGLQFYSAYPMSPSSNTLHYVAAQQDKFPLVVRHAEDEISAINHAVGASYAGVRAMTGTAGGGYALMVETTSLIGVTEVPLVILVAMRPGPATGLPTWTSQGDLQFILHAGHGEFQRVIFTPGSVEEHFQLTQHAFYIAEKYHIPVFILTDKYIIEAHQNMPRPVDEYQIERQSFVNPADLPEDNSYRRFKITDNGISPRSIPGMPHGLQVTNSYEHDEFGYATEDAEMTVAQVEKRARKMDGIKQEMPAPYLLGSPDAELTFVCWGSTVNVLQEVLVQLRVQNLERRANIIHLPVVWPFPAEQFSELAKNAKKLVMVEGNFDGQCEQLIRQETGIQFADRIRRYDGRPFYSEDIVEWVKNSK